MMKLKLLLTGNELMTGDTLDSNSAMIAKMCLDTGIQVHYKATVSDDIDQLVSEISRLSEISDVLIVNGGLGPTTDDLTAEALAIAMNVKLEEHPVAIKHLTAWCIKRNYGLSEANRKQAILPKGVKIVANASGSAVGFKIKLNNCLIICTPGVPHELKTMMAQEILPQLSALLPNSHQPKRVRFRVFGYGESNLQELITKTYPNWPDQLELGFRASMPLLELKLKVDRQEDHALLNEWQAKIKTLVGAHIVTDDNRSLANVVVDLLVLQDKKITFAESCTGGKIASLLTEVSGASSVFEAGIISYSNAIKTSLLNVSESDLLAQGAVSETVVRQMLSGALAASGADLGVSVSGIAGPNGGSADKPVGTVYLAWGSQTSMQARAFYFPGNRIFFQQIVSALALDLVRRDLLGLDETPLYFKERKVPN
jgi:nicotinamide-nucleotide amidase